MLKAEQKLRTGLYGSSSLQILPSNLLLLQEPATAILSAASHFWGRMELRSVCVFASALLSHPAVPPAFVRREYFPGSHTTCQLPSSVAGRVC